MKIQNAIQLLTLALVTALTGCGTIVEPIYRNSLEARNTLEQLRTTDTQEIRRRWGDYVDFVDKVWVHERAGSLDWRDVKWLTPGVVISEVYGSCQQSACTKGTRSSLFSRLSNSSCQQSACTKGERLLQYNPSKQRIERYSSENSLLDVGTIKKGSDIIFVMPVYPMPSEHLRFDRAKGELVSGPFAFRETSHENIAAITGFSRAALDASHQKPSPQQARQHDVSLAAARKEDSVQRVATLQKTAADYSQKFPVINTGKTVEGKLLTKNKNTEPAIYVMNGKKQQKLNLTLQAKGFTPLLSVYQADGSKVDSISGKSPIKHEIILPDDSVYMLAVFSLEPGAKGNFSLEIEEGITGN